MNVRGVFQTQILSLLSLAFLASGCQEFDRLRLILKPEQFPEGLQRAPSGLGQSAASYWDNSRAKWTRRAA